MSNENDYYENPSHWDSDIYLHGVEAVRLKQAISMVPAGVENVLDVGAGNGVFINQLKEAIPGLSVYGVERSLSAIHAAPQAGYIIQGTAERIPFRDNSFHLVASLNTIEHFPCHLYENALKDLERVASEYILISVPYRERRLKVICPYCTCEFNPSYHMRSFDLEKLKSLFTEFELSEIKMTMHKESIIKVIAGPMRKYAFTKYPDTALCPQCGYKNATSAEHNMLANESVTRAPFMRALKRINSYIPAINVPRNIIVLYKRNPS